MSTVGYVADLRIAFANDNADVHFFHSKGRFPVGVNGLSHDVVAEDDWLYLADAECRDFLHPLEIRLKTRVQRDMRKLSLNNFHEKKEQKRITK